MPRISVRFRLGYPVLTKHLVELGDLFCKRTADRPVWRVAGFVRHAPLPHVKLTQVDATGTQITVSVAALADPRLYRRVQP